MTIALFNILRNPNVGLYSIATDRFVVLPSLPGVKHSKFENCLSVKSIKICIGGSTLNGVLAVANSYGMILPYFADKEEIKLLRSECSDIRIDIVQCKETALGNLVLANNKGAIVCPTFPSATLSTIADALNVEVVKGTIAGLSIVGSLAIATNKGALAHPSLREEEKSLLEDVLKVPVNVGTVNSGVGFIKSGVVANTNGAIVGDMSTGSELATIGAALRLV